MVTVNVVKGSVDEAILKKQYGDKINYNYTDSNQYVGSDRVATNKMYQEELSKAGIKADDAGDMWSYKGSTGGSSSKSSAPKATDNTEYIKEQSDAALQSTLSAIRAAVQQNIAKQKSVISKIPEQYQNLKNIVYNQSLAALPGLRERIANLGASTEGGYSRTEETKANSDLQNRLGELDRQKQDVIDQANQEIASLEAQGRIDESNATAEAANSRLQMIIQESNRLDALNNQNYWNSQDYALNLAGLTGTIDGQSTLAKQTLDLNQANWQKEFDAEQAARQWQQDYQEKGFSADQAYRMAQLDLEKRRIAIEQQNANTSAARLNQEGSSLKMNDLIQRLNNLYVIKDSVTGESYVNPNTKDQLRAAIIGYGLPDADTDRLLLYYGLPIND